MISRVEEDAAVSGMISFGTTPYFSTRFANISH